MMKKSLSMLLAAVLLFACSLTAFAGEGYPFHGHWGLDTTRAVIFASDGGSYIRPVEVQQGTVLNLDDYIPVKAGHVFGGWYADPRTKTERIAEVTLEENIVVYAKWLDDGTPKLTKIEIICKESRFEALKEAMMSIGITGMTVSHVLGCGIQKGKPEYYRGVQIETNLLPKIQVDIVVSKVPVDTVIRTARDVLYTGHIGDGKIFVYDVENVVKIRTGEEGYDALQDDAELEMMKSGKD